MHDVKIIIKARHVQITGQCTARRFHGSEIMIKFCKVIITVKHSSFTKFLLIYMSIHEKNLFDNLFF